MLGTNQQSGPGPRAARNQQKTKNTEISRCNAQQGRKIGGREVVGEREKTLAERVKLINVRNGGLLRSHDTCWARVQ